MKTSAQTIVVGWPRDLLIAVAAAMLATGLYIALGPAVALKTPLVPFLVAVLFAGSFSTRAGVVAIAMGAVALATALPPAGIPWAVGQVDQIVWVVFVITASCIVLICGSMHRGRRRVQMQADALRDAEQSASWLNRRFQITVDAGRMVVWDWDLSDVTVVRSENAMELFGLGDQPYVDFLELVDPDDRPRLEAAVRSAIDEGSGYYCEYRARCVDGSLRWLGDRARVVETAAGKRHLTGAAADITERVRLEQRLRHEDQQKDLFIATLAHEMRNPLAPLSNGLEVLRRSLPESQAIVATHATMERQLGHIGQLLDNLLDVSRITHGKITLERQRLPLGRIIETSIETVQPLLDRFMQKIELEGMTIAQEIDGDLVRMTQVFANLVNNASRFSPPGATITLSTRNLGNLVEISIVDTGRGIPSQYLERIFDLFWQVPEPEGGSPRGLGIGLSFAQTLVALHGGTLSVRSEGLGHGTTAVVSLPTVLTTVATLRSSPAQIPQEPTAARRILVVDDNVDAAQALAIILQMDGHLAEVADSGAMALELAAVSSPDLAILDIGMPEMDGLELCRRLRQTPAGASMLIVALTGWGDSDIRRKSLEAGFNAHFVKPLSGDDRARLLAMQVPSTGSVKDAAVWDTAPLPTVTVDLQSRVLRADDGGGELH
ncbi:MAG: response regulator [Ferrovibrio sp.]|uniref:hybrid sensor histidine kinase/response regulator n=1 Tax=Ferrovibrio sp. TaxID=1917215 RepID=UPI0026223C7C|nr:ATP-binding protein [Ferrovibrio sp.]MCW0235758.1 response regulator [Ferrovibrio sp.]